MTQINEMTMVEALAFLAAECGLEVKPDYSNTAIGMGTRRWSLYWGNDVHVTVRARYGHGDSVKTGEEVRGYRFDVELQHSSTLRTAAQWSHEIACLTQGLALLNLVEAATVGLIWPDVTKLATKVHLTRL